MKWYRLTSRDGELIAAERILAAQRHPSVSYGGVTFQPSECRQFGQDHVCIVQAEGIEDALPQRCTKSCMR